MGMKNLNETPFKGSPLETEMRNISTLDKLKIFKSWTNTACELQPDSVFWKDALIFINKVKL